jgi:hypothetical protein
VAILKIVDHNGDLVYEYNPPLGEQVIRTEHTFLISSILSDNAARAPMFGANSILNLPFPAAVKTGTSGFSGSIFDNWTIGYTPDITVGVWVGNADYTPLQNTTGMSGAAPIWSQFMQAAIQQLTGGNPTPFIAPGGVVVRVICAESGSEPSQWCPTQRSEYFVNDQLPLPASKDLWQKVLLDTWTNLLASTQCSDFTEEVLVLNVIDPFARAWIMGDADGQNWSRSMGFPENVIFTPERECNSGDARPNLDLVGLHANMDISTSPLDISVIASGENFQSYHVDYGIGAEPHTWIVLFNPSTVQVPSATKIYTWDLSTINETVITLRIYMTSTNGGYAEKRIRLNMHLPTPTPTPSVTPTVLPDETSMPWEPPVPGITPTPIPD